MSYYFDEYKEKVGGLFEKLRLELNKSMYGDFKGPKALQKMIRNVLRIPIMFVSKVIFKNKTEYYGERFTDFLYASEHGEKGSDNEEK
jgi:hypothetical protein